MRIDGFVAIMIMPYNVLQIDRFSHAGPLIQFAGEAPQVWIVDDPFAITLEVKVINAVKTDQCRPKPPVCFGQPIPEQIAVARENVFEPVKALKKRMHGGVICLLAGRKA